MKLIKYIFALSAVGLLLCGCKSNAEKNKSDSKFSDALPIISIQTKSNDSDVLKFINEPVAKLVSADVATWTPGYQMPPEPYYESCTVMLKDSDGKKLLDSADAEVKVRGNWTTLYPKKPLRIKFETKQNLLGLNNGAEFKNWLLLAEYKDASMLRNKAALYASREILANDGLYAPDADFVQVVVNGEYQGLYLLTEMLQVNENRINVNKPEKDYTGTDIGYFLEFDGYFPNEDELQSFPLTLNNNAPLIPYDGNNGSGKSIQCITPDNDEYHQDIGMTIHSNIYSQEQHDFIENYVNNVYTIMYEAAYNDKAFIFDKDYSKIYETSEITPQQAVENVVNIDSLADMYIISELTCDADITWSSFYMSTDFSASGDKKLTFEAPWDFDSSMGNKPRCLDGQGFYAANIVPSPSTSQDTINPWLTVLAYEDWYQEIVKEKWTDISDSDILGNTIDLIKKDSETLTKDFEINYSKWDNIIQNELFVDELSIHARLVKNEAEAAEFLISWLESRIDFLDSQWHISK